MMNEGMSPADVVALSGNDGFGGSSSWFWIVVLFLFGFGNGFGWGGNNQVATSSEVQRGFDNQNIMSRFDTLQVQQSANAMDNQALISQNRYDNAVLIKDAQYTNLQNTNALAASLNQNADAIVLSQTNGFNNVTSGINDLGYQIQSTSCATNRNIDSVKYENAQNTCAITSAIHQEGELTRGLIQANTIQDLRDRLEEKDRLYQAANYTLANSTQTRTILDSLGRWVSNPPVPYVVSSYGTVYGTTV